MKHTHPVMQFPSCRNPLATVLCLLCAFFWYASNASGSERWNDTSAFVPGSHESTASTLTLTCTTSIIQYVTCFGQNNGMASVSASGGVPPYVFNWGNANPNALAAGVYTVTVTDDVASTSTCTVAMLQPLPLTGMTSVLQDVTCFGGNDGVATVSGWGGIPPYNYNWGDDDPNALEAGTFTVTLTDNNSCTTTNEVTIEQPDLLTCGITLLQQVTCPGCSNGQALASASGGIPPYQLDWGGADPNALSVGTYTVTVTDDHACTSTCEVTVNEVIPLSCAASVVQYVSCYGESDGIASAAGMGGTPPYQYNWGMANPNALSAGIYTVTVTDEIGNASTCSVAMLQPLPLTGLATVLQDVSCFGGDDGMASVSGWGGIPPYSFNWGNADPNALSAGTFFVTVTDNHGCTTATQVVIAEPDILSCSTLVIQHVSCAGCSDGVASVTASGGTPPYQFDWNGADPNALQAGTYEVTVTDDNSCASTCEVTINLAIALTCSVQVIQHVTCFGGSDGAAEASAEGGTPPYAFDWGPADPEALMAGTYAVTVTDAGEQMSTCAVTIMEPSMLIAEATVVQDVSCYGEMNGMAGASATGGVPPYLIDWGDDDPEALPAGNYIVTVTDLQGCISTAGVTIEEPGELTCITAIIQYASCPGCANGIASVEGMGGTPPYNYDWGGENPGALRAGTYGVTVTDAHACTSECEVTIEFLALLECAIEVIEEPSSICDGGAYPLTAIVDGGAPPYTYDWTVVLLDGVIEVPEDPADFGWSITSGQGTSSISFMTGTTYRARFKLNISDANGVSSDCEVEVDPCTMTTVLETLCGDVNPSIDLSLELYEGPEGYGSLPLASATTYGDMDGVLDFGFPNLDPDDTYTLCELGLPAGMSVVWSVDTDGDGQADTQVNLYNPDAPDEDMGNRCVDFGAGTLYPLVFGEVLSFEIDLCPTSGSARTPGYWQNWSTCSGGNQAETAENNGGPANGFWLIDDVLPITWCAGTNDAFVIDNCEDAVNLLGHRQICGNHKKSANDAAYKVARNLLALQANLAAGAASCPGILDAASEAEALLCAVGFDGCGNYIRPNHNLWSYANCLAGCLDAYNNNAFCPGECECQQNFVVAGSGDGTVQEIPQVHQVSENQYLEVAAYPNPSPGDILIEFNVAQDERVTVEILDLLGRKVDRISQTACKAGILQHAWVRHEKLGPGTYVYMLYSDTWSYFGKIVLANH